MTNKPRSNGLTGKPSNNKGKVKNGPHTTISVRMPQSLLDAVRDKAEQDELTANAIMVMAISACVGVATVED